MPPVLALTIWLALLFGLLRFDPAREPGTSFALWIPLLWMLIIGSRLPSQWFGLQVGSLAQAMAEGNPLDRSIDLAMIVICVAVLAARSFNWGSFVLRNLALTAFVVFALISIAWSDFPFVAFKRWFRDLGNYLVILVVLSDPRPLEAVRTLLRRLFYLLIPLCILLDKYFPNLSKQYDQWSGASMYVGATTGKNLLGLVALLSGLFFFWDTVTRWSDRKERRTRRIIVVDIVFLAMSLSVLNTANSATCRVCMVIGCLIIAAAHSRAFRRRPAFLKVLIPASFCLYVILAFGFGASGELATAVGKDPTLTDRTKIWATALSMHTNPLLGTGYESFWMGPRLERFWQTSGLGRINEAHNGFLEVYLNLGAVGLLLLGAFLIVGYRNICRQFTTSSDLASLNLALWEVMMFYCVTEAGFRSTLLWLVFLLGGIAGPALAGNEVRNIVSSYNASNRERFLRPRLEAASRRR